MKELIKLGYNILDEIDVSAFKEFLKRIEMTKDGEIVDLVATPGFCDEIKL